MPLWKPLVASFSLAGSLLVAATPAIAADLPRSRPEAEGLSSQRLARISAMIQADVAAGKLPGAVWMVGRHGKLVHFETLGRLGPDAPTPMPKDAIFRIYSMSKPIASVAAMMLVEEGRLKLDDPVSLYIPSFGQLQVGSEKPGPDGQPVLTLAPAQRTMTVQDLLRHTSGLTYGFFGQSLVRQAYDKADLFRDGTLAEFTERIAALPLAHEPGTTWEYSHSTDVLGRVIEVAAGQPLSAFLKERLFDPLGMKDTAFYVTDTAKHHRIAEPLNTDRQLGVNVDMHDPRRLAKMESAGGGLASTAMDYARFVQMLRNGGQLDGRRYLGPKTLAFMVSDHLGPNIARTPLYLPGAGVGFGLGFAVRTATGESTTPGSVGSFSWGGAAGTLFWVDPQTDLWVVLMIQSVQQRDRYRTLLMDMVYAAVEE